MGVILAPDKIGGFGIFGLGVYQNPSKLPPPHHCSIRTNQTTSTLWLVINYFSFAIAFMTCQCHSRALLRILYCTTTSTYVSTKNSRTTSEVFNNEISTRKGSRFLTCIIHLLCCVCATHLRTLASCRL